MYEELIMPAIDMAIAMLKRFEPIIFPTIKSNFPFLADWILAASSGKLVPKAANVKPMTYVLTPRVIAI